MAPFSNQAPGKGLQPVVIGNINQGGIADSDLMGLPNSMAEIVGLDLHSEPGILKVNQKMVKEGSNSPNEFCKERINATNGCQYWCSSSTGKIWERAANGTWRSPVTIAAKNGESKILGASEFDGYLYFATQNFLHRIKTSLASGSSWSSDLELNWADLTLDLETRRKASVTMNFDGVDDYIAIGASVITHSNNVTFECWFYVEDDVTEATPYTIWGANNTASMMQIELGGDTTDAPNRNRIAVYSGSTISAQTDNNAFESGTWNHLVFTRSTSGAGNDHIYVNGVERTLLTNDGVSFSNTSTAKYIGARTTTTKFFKGRLKNIIIRSAAMTAQQVADTYNDIEYISSGIIAAYSLNLSVQDYGATNHGTITGNPEYGYEDVELAFATNLATSLSEKDTERRMFVANNEEIDYIKVWVTKKGTHDLTLTIHTAANAVVGSAVTVSNANLVNGWNYIAVNLSGLSIGSTYHYHLHASGNSVYVKTNNLTDISDAYVQMLSDGDIDFHPMIQQNIVLFIGNKNYIEQVSIDLTTGEHVFTKKALDFIYPLRAKTLARFDTDLVVGTYVDNNINETLVLRWNTYSASWTYSDPVPEKGINAFLEADNYLMAVAGVEGRIYMYDGKNLVLMRGIKGDYDGNKQITVHPNAVALFKTIPFFGVSNISGDPALQGIYSYGSRNASYPTILTLELPISERNTGEFVLSGIEIGALLVVGTDLYASWKHGSSYGVDKIDYTTKLEKGYTTTLVMDPTKIYTNNFMQYIAKYWKLPTNTSIKIEYLKEDGSWQDLGAVKEELQKQYIATETLNVVDLQLRFTLITSGNSTPKVKEFIVQLD